MPLKNFRSVLRGGNYARPAGADRINLISLVDYLTELHMLVKELARVASRYAPSRGLSFGEVHVLKSLQLVAEQGTISRELLRRELGLGEGSVKTLVKHMKMNSLVRTSNRGTTMTEKGKAVFAQVSAAIPSETSLAKCAIGLGKFNHAVLLRELGYAVKSGIEQRDAAIRIGGTGATTLLFLDAKFVMPGTAPLQDSLKKDAATRSLLVSRLKPQQGDLIIVGSADTDRRTAELAAKNAALFTLRDHAKHY